MSDENFNELFENDFFKDKFDTRVEKHLKSYNRKIEELEKKFDNITHLEVKTVYSKEIQEQIAELQKYRKDMQDQINHDYKTINELQKNYKDLNEDYIRCMRDITDSLNANFRKRTNLEEVLREFYKHKLAKADYTIECLSSKEHVAEKMVDYVKNDIIFYKRQLEKLDSKQAEKKEVYVPPKIDLEDIEESDLFKSGRLGGEKKWKLELHNINVSSVIEKYDFGRDIMILWVILLRGK